jgi:hypothetical protein
MVHTNPIIVITRQIPHRTKALCESRLIGMAQDHLINVNQILEDLRQGQ